MSGAVTAAAVATVAGAAYSVYSGERAAKEQKKAQRNAQRNADKQLSQAEQDANRSRTNRPDTAGMLDAAQQTSMAGPAGTMLTGAQGVDPNQLQLSKNTLLGS